MAASKCRLRSSCRVFPQKRRPFRTVSLDRSANFLAEDDVVARASRLRVSDLQAGGSRYLPINFS